MTLLVREAQRIIDGGRRTHLGLEKGTENSVA